MDGFAIEMAIWGANSASSAAQDNPVKADLRKAIDFDVRAGYVVSYSDCSIQYSLKNV